MREVQDRTISLSEMANMVNQGGWRISDGGDEIWGLLADGDSFANRFSRDVTEVTVGESGLCLVLADDERIELSFMKRTVEVHTDWGGLKIIAVIPRDNFDGLWHIEDRLVTFDNHAAIQAQSDEAEARMIQEAASARVREVNFVRSLVDQYAGCEVSNFVRSGDDLVITFFNGLELKIASCGGVNGFHLDGGYPCSEHDNQEN